MAIVVKDRVQQTSTTTGTADFVLTGSVTGFQSFAAIGNTNTTYYAAVDPNTGAWEVGTGTYSTTGPTLTRTTIFESSTGGSKIDFAAGAKNVFCVYPAERAIYEEPSGNTLIDGGPLTVVGLGVPSGGYTTFSAALGEFYGDVDNYAQLYVQNLNDGSDASADFAAYNDISDGETFFVDVGVSSSNASPAGYDLLTPNSTYLIGYGDGDTLNSDMFVGSGDGDLNLFAGGFTNADIAINIDKSDKSVNTIADVNVGGALDVTGATTFNSTVLLDANPTLALEAATKQYVDAQASSAFVVHTSARAATTANLSTIYNNGTAGVGATLTADTNREFMTLDGVTGWSLGQRVLVKNQTASADNGIYTLTDLGSTGVSPWVLTRATDFDTAGTGEIANNAYVYVTAGSTQIGTSWVLAQLAAITVGTTALPFDLFAQPVAYTVSAPLDLTGTNLSLTGTVAATNGGTGTNTVTTGDLLYGSGTNTWDKLAAGAAYKSLVMNGAGSNVEWNAVALNQAGAVSGALGATNGGTGQSSYAVGDILYSGLVNTLAKLAGNTTTTKKVLTQTGTGAASAAPAWDTISSGDITGLGTMATQDANNVAISGGNINGTVIGNSSPQSGAFTTLTANSGSTVLDASNYTTYADPAGTAVAMAIALG
jgi:hypothetical protein